ncbi:hypothetical protein Scani_46210 [Streptomyces caniferus]|uniref:Uncharacterized protein n=1 Tax=Streptomyces caniferus TaxID=285557 RepID=A0A640SAB1_9ACTN|nr:hypothetical protein Scani_46210 [Streptomyces caniferus]
MLKRGADLRPVSGMATLLLEGVGLKTTAWIFYDREWDNHRHPKVARGPRAVLVVAAARRTMPHGRAGLGLLHRGPGGITLWRSVRASEEAALRRFTAARGASPGRSRR